MTFFLGLEISRPEDGISVHQRKYAEDLIKFAHLENAKLFDMPLEINVKLNKDDGRPLKILLYSINWFAVYHIWH